MTVLIGTSTKMNLTSTEAGAYLDALLPLVADVADRDVFVILPFTSIWVARDRLAGSHIGWGAQDVHPEDRGAHTGDVSAPMLADLGCTYVEVGHHERRRDYGETDELIAAKVDAVQRWGMRAIVCVGEPERLPWDGVQATITRQVGRLGGFDPRRLVFAYEPAWAIGVGAEAAPVEWVARVHGEIHRQVDPTIPVIYGGSVSTAVAPSLLAERGVDGLFVGRMALDPAVFAAIAHTRAKPG